MRIALVSDSIYPYNKGGKEIRSYELAKKLSENKYKVDFYTMKFWKGKNSIKKYGFNLHGISKEYPLYINQRRSIKQGILFGLSAFKLLRKNFDVLDADHMVYFHIWPCKLACLIKRKKLIVTWHEVWGKEYWKEYLGWKGIFGYWMEKLSSKLPKKIVVIPNAIDIKAIDKIKPSKETSDIIFAGRLMNHKNVNILIKAISIIKQNTNPNIKCIIVGDGEEMQNLKTLAKSLNLNKNIIFKGFIKEHAEVLSLMKSSKLFVLPSTREGFGITVIEANACGIPVITTKHKDNASRFLIDEGNNGYTTDLNEYDLSNKIEKSLEKANKSGWNTKQYVKKYDWNNII